MRWTPWIVSKDNGVVAQIVRKYYVANIHHVLYLQPLAVPLAQNQAGVHAMQGEPSVLPSAPHQTSYPTLCLPSLHVISALDNTMHITGLYRLHSLRRSL